MINGVTGSAHAAGRPTEREAAGASQEARPAKPGSVPADAVELSEAAQEQLRHSESMPIRTTLVERVRAEIAAGTYLTDDKLDVAVSRVHEEMSAVA